MSLGAGFRSVYDEIKNLRIRSKEESELPPNIKTMMPDMLKRQQTLKRTQSKDRSSVGGGWRENRCCCQQRVNESEKICRKIAEENAELRRLCIYLDDQRQQALNEITQWRNGRQNGSCWYSDPTCCGSNCEFRCPVNPTDAPTNEPDSPVLQQNEELLNYIHSLESRILTLEEGKTSIHRDGILFGKTRRPLRSVSQQHSPMNSTPTSTTRDYTLQAQQNQQIHIMDSSQSTLTDSGTTYYSSELDRDSDEEESNSAATTVYIKRASNAANNLEQFVNQQRNVDQRSAVGLVRKFLSTRETLLQALKKRNEMASVGDFGYSVIQRKNKNGLEADEQWSESRDLPPSLPEMKRKFTPEKPMNNGRQLARQVA